MEDIKIGVFGTFRGLQFIEAINILDGAVVTAICDRDESKLADARKILPADIKVCKDFDELLDSGIDAVILTNFFNEHAPYAIKAMKKGIHVLSETTAAISMKECVELCETVEETGCIYSLAENYPYFRANMEMEDVYKSGIVGDVIFAEGEYIHPMSREENEFYNPGPDHWRTQTPCTYYCTHAMAPLMKITDLMPRKVIGKVAAGWSYAEDLGFTGSGDNYGVLLCEMDNGALFRVGGCGAFGPKGNWYRLGCSRGGVESIRGDMNKVRLCVSPWYLNDSNKDCTEKVYTPALKEGGEKAANFEHGGADYWVTKDFIADVCEKKEPYMNVYRAAALSAIGILGWESVCEGSKQLDVPDFRNKEEREKYRSDDRTPFVREGQSEQLASCYWKK